MWGLASLLRASVSVTVRQDLPLTDCRVRLVLPPPLALSDSSLVLFPDVASQRGATEGDIEDDDKDWNSSGALSMEQDHELGLLHSDITGLARLGKDSAQVLSPLCIGCCALSVQILIHILVHEPPCLMSSLLRACVLYLMTCVLFHLTFKSFAFNCRLCHLRK